VAATGDHCGRDPQSVKALKSLGIIKAFAATVWVSSQLPSCWRISEEKGSLDDTLALCVRIMGPFNLTSLVANQMRSFGAGSFIGRDQCEGTHRHQYFSADNGWNSFLYNYGYAKSMPLLLSVALAPSRHSPALTSDFIPIRSYRANSSKGMGSLVRPMPLRFK